MRGMQMTRYVNETSGRLDPLTHLHVAGLQASAVAPSVPLPSPPPPFRPSSRVSRSVELTWFVVNVMASIGWSRIQVLLH